MKDSLAIVMQISILSSVRCYTKKATRWSSCFE